MTKMLSASGGLRTPDPLTRGSAPGRLCLRGWAPLLHITTLTTDHMHVCTLLQTDNHTSTEPLCFCTGRMPFLSPNQQRQSTEGKRIFTTWGKKGKVFPYSLPSVGPGADPGVQAVSPQVTWSESRHIPSSSLPLLSARAAFTFVALTRWRYL